MSGYPPPHTYFQCVSSLAYGFEELLGLPRPYSKDASLIYSPFHKTLPRSSLEMHWISVRFYEIGFMYMKMNDPPLTTLV